MEDNSITASSSMPCLGQGLQLRVDFASTVTPGNSLNQPSGIYYSSPLRRFCMAEAPRITVEELKRRMEDADRGAQTRGLDGIGYGDTRSDPSAVGQTRREPVQNPKDRPVEYENVWALQGGFHAWQNAGLPVESRRQAA